MKYFGLIIMVLGALLSYFSKKILIKMQKTDEPSDKEVAITKIVGFTIATIGILVVFYC